MWLKLLFAVVSVLVHIDSPPSNNPDQPPEVAPSEDNHPPVPNDNNPTPQENIPDTPSSSEPNEPSEIPEGNNPTSPDNVPDTPANQPNEPSGTPEDNQNPTTPDSTTPPVEPTNNDNMLNLHVMLASHTDAGWIHTFENYYQGTNSLDGGCVKCILNNLMDSLPKKKDRKYDMSEIAFFKRWWSDQNQERKNHFKSLLQDKQVEFINGAWAANDEATAYYEDIMDNFILGHRWLQDNLDLDPLLGWQVDSFGNSATHAALMAQAGYQGLFFSRADYKDRETRRQEQSLQYNWAPPNPHNETVFTQMMYVTYSDNKFMVAENYNCRSIFCEGNLTDIKFNQVVEYVRKQQQAFKTNNLLFLVCDDFLLWGESEKDYTGVENMIQHFKDHPELGINAKFSHLSDYVDQVKKDFARLGPNVTIPVKHDDTFPYVEKNGHVWTGYFTSKPMFKLLVREYSEYYNAVKLLLGKIMLLNQTNTWDAARHNGVNQALVGLEEPLAIVQHHDAVSGTMKEFVKADYQSMLDSSRSSLETTIEPIVVKYLQDKIGEELAPYSVKYDWFYQDKSYDNMFKPDSTPTFSVFNPGQTRKFLIKVKVPAVGSAIVNEANQQLEADTVCHSEDTNSECFMYFLDDFAAYSVKVYKIIGAPNAQKLTPLEINNQDQEISAGEKLSMKVKGDLQNFEYNYCQEADKCTTDSFNLNYLYYESNWRPGDVAPSGAYVFNPASSEKMEYSSIKSGRIYKGKYFTLIQIFRGALRTDMSIFNHQPERGIEITSYLEPLDLNPFGKEIVLVAKSNSVNNGNTIFYTDTNGYYMQRRQKNYKEHFQLDTSNGINVNFYPLTSNMYIQDETSGQRFSVVTDRAQGGTSLNTGEVEIMIHRVTVLDDNKGVGEALQEKDANWNLIKVMTRHFLSYSNPTQGINDQRRQQQYDLDRPPQLWFYASKSTGFSGTVNNAQQTEPVVPELVKLYIRSYELNEYIIRLHNMDENNPKQVQIFDMSSKTSNLLQQLAGKDYIKVSSVVELSWMTTMDKADVPKNELDPNEPVITHNDNQDLSSISLLPMEIRTFSIQVEI